MAENSNNNIEEKEKNKEAAKAAGEQAKQESAKPDAEAQDLKERLLRLAAEFDNYKKRTSADIQRSRLEGKAEAIRPLLGILDEFELTLIAASKSEDKKLTKGIEMLYANLTEMLRKEGLSEIKTDGSYDPYVHEIMQTKESDKTEGSILEVVRKGYTFCGIMLRPASVIVAAQKPAENANEAKS
jgi:molecular chaperone GrpE